MSRACSVPAMKEVEEARRGFERLVPGLKETVQVMRQGESARERRTPQEARFGVEKPTQKKTCNRLERASRPR